MATIEIQLQNARVWARRLDVIYGEEAYRRALLTHFEGSVLKGPLAVVISRFLITKSDIDLPLAERRLYANIVSGGLARVLREEENDPLRAMAKVACGLGEEAVFTLADHRVSMVELIQTALDARDKEYARPNVVGVVLDFTKHR